MPKSYDEERVLREAIKRGRIEPSPAGSISTGRLPSDTYVSVDCRGHVFRVHKAEKSPAWQSGYKQAATCIVCDEEVHPRDASWWMELATVEDVRQAIALAKQEAQRLREVFELLRGLIDGNSVRGNERPAARPKKRRPH